MSHITNADKNKKLIIAIWIAGILFAAWPRYYQIGKLCGFEHDESLIALGAQMIAAGETFPLTGDKVYEGPFLEYISAVFFRIFGESVESIRYIMATAGLGALICVSLLSARLFGAATAPFVIWTGAFFPWGLCASRIIYACNLVPFTLSAGFLAAVATKKRYILRSVAAGIFLGLSMHGHFYVMVLFPVFLYALFINRPDSGKRASISLFFTGGIILSFSPVLVYNTIHGFPSVKIFLGREAHSVTKDSNLLVSVPARILGYLYTTFAAWTGKMPWLDVRPPGRPLLLLLPLAAVSFLISFKKAVFEKNKTDRMILGWILPSAVIIPLISKHRTEPQILGFILPSIPHYLDIIFPVSMLLPARLFALKPLRTAKRPAKTALLIIGFLLVIDHTAYSLFQLYPAVKNGDVGRWRRGIRKACETIRKSSRKNSVLFVPYVFEGGFPQCTFLLPQMKIEPVLSLPRGYYEGQAPVAAQAFYLVRTLSPIPLFSDLKPFEEIPDPHMPLWKIYRYETPEVHLEGFFTSSQNQNVYLKLHQIKNSIKNGFVVLNPDFSVKKPPHLIPEADKIHISSVERQELFQRHSVFGKRRFFISDRHRPLMEKLGRIPVASRLSIVINDQDKNIKMTLLADFRSPLMKLALTYGETTFLASEKELQTTIIR